MKSFNSKAERVASRSDRARWACCLAAALAAVTVASEASAQTLQVAFSQTLRGGLSTDAWGETSSPTTFARGELHVQVPRGGRVRWARLFSGFTVFYNSTPAPAWPPVVPAGPAGSPRQVILGTGASAITRALEGVPRFFSATRPTTTRLAYWGTFATDVTAAVAAAVGPSSRGGVTRIAIAERGDDAPREDFNRIQIGGHFLAVVYDLDFGPQRNVVVYEGAATSGYESASLALPGAVANRCPMTALPRTEAFAASVGVMWEFNRRPSATAPNDPSRDTCSEEESEIFVNGNMLTQRAGGADDWPSVASGMGCFGDTAGLVTMGTFGGNEPGLGRAAGSPIGLDGDEVLTPPALPRLDDELYDFRTVVRDNARTMQFRFGTDGDEMIPVIAFQTLARLNAGDADGDGWSDTIEGDCSVDSDNDGTPDYLDTDSDNDCLSDARETATGRADASRPGAADMNCPATAPVCDRSAGVCLCNADRDCARNPGAPVCDAATRTCVSCRADSQCASIDPARPACAIAGPNMGRCVPCRLDAQCPGATPRCDPAQNVCVACVSGRDCADPSMPVCDATRRVCRPCSPATASTDCTEPGVAACASSGANAGRCVQCVTNTDCRSGSCDPATNTCVGCTSDTDCAGATPICDVANRRCRACSTGDCSGATPVCATTGRSAGRCVQCTASSAGACSGATPVCDESMNACVGCLPGAMSPSCATNPDGAACVTDATGANRCGCAVDGDCGGADSGRICDPDTRRCRAGCWPGDGHNGCPAGSACSSDDPTRPGVCAAGCFRDLDCRPPTPYCAVGDGASGACVECRVSAHCAGRPDGRAQCSAAGACVVPVGEIVDGDGGCGCRARTTPSARFGLIAFGLCAVAALARRRRR